MLKVRYVVGGDVKSGDSYDINSTSIPTINQMISALSQSENFNPQKIDPKLRIITGFDKIHVLASVRRGLIEEMFSLQTNEAEVDTISSAVVHTSVSFGAENIDRNAKDVQEVLLKCVADTCKSLQGKDPAFVKCHKWRYILSGKKMRISNGYEGAPGFVILSKTPLILAAGDGFVQSGYENCILSGERTAAYLIEAMK